MSDFRFRIYFIVMLRNEASASGDWKVYRFFAMLRMTIGLIAFKLKKVPRTAKHLFFIYHSEIGIPTSEITITLLLLQKELVP